MSNERMFLSTPLIKLGDENFKKVNDFLKRFASIPDIIELDHLTVSGNVTFGKKVVLKGTVIIIANHGEQIDIPSGAILENKIVSGNLRILDHWARDKIKQQLLCILRTERTMLLVKYTMFENYSKCLI